MGSRMRRRDAFEPISGAGCRLIMGELRGGSSLRGRRSRWWCGTVALPPRAEPPVGRWTRPPASRNVTLMARNRSFGNHKSWIWLLAVLSLWGGAAAAETYTVGAIEIGNPWARATPKGAPVGGAYMSITNKGAEADRLIGIASPV